MAEKRQHRMEIRLSDDEFEMIDNKFRLSNSKNKTNFIRGLILNGVVVQLNEQNLKDIYRTVSSVANNINQIAVRVNSTGNIYTEDIAEIKKGADTILQQQRYFQSELLKLKR